jgi:molybdenum cofactor guanylyltransferase
VTAGGSPPTPPAFAFAGAVLCGGASRRMGRDKALLPLGGRALAVRVADALAAAGAGRVVAVGGDLAGLRAAGLDAVPDEAPGAGPLTGVLTALANLGATGRDVVFVGSCDLVAPDRDAVRRTVAALAGAPGADAAVPVVGGRRQWLHAAWRGRARVPLAAAFAAGERSVHGAVARAGLHVVDLDLPPASVADADRPGDLPAETGDGGPGPTG